MTDATFEAEVLKSDIPVLVDFWAPWCGPCRMIAPLIDQLAEEYSGKLKAVSKKCNLALLDLLPDITTLVLLSYNTCERITPARILVPHIGQVEHRREPQCCN